MVRELGEIMNKGNSAYNGNSNPSGPCPMKGISNVTGEPLNIHWDDLR